METPTIVIVTVLICALLGAMGQIFFKMSSANFSFNPIEMITNWKFIFGAFLYATSAILFVWTLKYGNLSILYPVIATSYIWVTLLSVVLLGESFNSIKWIGIAMIISGIYIIVK